MYSRTGFIKFVVVVLLLVFITNPTTREHFLAGPVFWLLVGWLIFGLYRKKKRHESRRTPEQQLAVSRGYELVGWLAIALAAGQFIYVLNMPNQGGLAGLFVIFLGLPLLIIGLYLINRRLHWQQKASSGAGSAPGLGSQVVSGVVKGLLIFLGILFLLQMLGWFIVPRLTG